MVDQSVMNYSDLNVISQEHLLRMQTFSGQETFTSRSGVMTYEVMEMITVEPKVRVTDRDLS